MKRIIRIALAGFVIGGAAFGFACNDDDGDNLTLAEYFAQVDAIDNQTDADINALFENSTGEDLQQFRDAFTSLGNILDEAADDLDDIDAPDEVRDEHNALVEAVRNWASGTADAVASTADVDAETPDELFVAFEGAGFGAGQQAFVPACAALQAVATDNSIDVDLNCDDDEDAAAAAEETVRDIAAAWNASDVEAFAALFTDAGLNSAFGEGEPATREELVAGLEGEVGSGALEIQEIESELTDAGADVTVLWISGSVLEHLRFSLIEQDDGLVADGVESLEVEAPADLATVDVDMSEFAFTFDASTITSTTPFVLQANNVGEQPHHVIFMKVPEGPTLEELLAAEEDPPGVEDVAGMAPVEPGSSSTIVVAKPLEPGRYVFLCFLPDVNEPDGPPHAFKGMASEFTVE